MKKSSEDIFIIINSLTKKEKDFFKRYTYLVTKNKSNPYTILFDAILKQKQYNEELLKKKLKKEIKYFAIVKSSLVQHLLKSLELFYNDGVIKNKVRSNINVIDILERKGLFKMQNAMIEKSIKLLNNGEHPLMIFLLQKKLNGFFRDIKTEAADHKEEKKVFDELLKISQMYIDEMQYLWLQLEMTKENVKYGVLRDDVGLQNLNKIVNKPLMQHLPNQSTFFSRIYFNHTWGTYYRTIDKDSEAISFFQKNLESFEKSSWENSELHFLALANLIVCYRTLLNLEQVKKCLIKMKHMIEKNDSLRNIPRVQFSYFENTLFHSSHTKNSIDRELLYAIEGIPKVFMKNASSEEKMKFYLGFANYYFIYGELSNSQFFINAALNLKSAKSIVVYYMSCLVQNALIHFEKGNMENVESTVNAGWYYINQHKANIKVLEYTLVFLEKMQKTTLNSMARKEEFIVYHKKLLDIKAELNEQENAILTELGLLNWAQSKIENCTISEILLKKVALANN